MHPSRSGLHTRIRPPAAAREAGDNRTLQFLGWFIEEQVEEERWVRDAAPELDGVVGTTPVPTAVVAVCTGDGIRRIFHSLGVQGVVLGGQTMNPSTAQLLEVVEAVPADEDTATVRSATANRDDAKAAYERAKVLGTRGIRRGTPFGRVRGRANMEAMS